MFSFENFQTKTQQNSWQNKQFQKSEINYQIKSQRIYFEDYDFQYDENWISKLEQNSSTYYDDDDYYENKSYDEILKTSAESEDLQSAESDQKVTETHFDEILNEKLIEMIKSSQFTLKCRQCEMKFYSNNKLHKHLFSDQHSKKHRETLKSHQKQIANISIVISTHSHKNHKDFVFKEHQYARVKNAFESKNNTHDLCADSRIFMFLINREFLERNVSDRNIKRTQFKLKMREIEFKIHDTFAYCNLDLYFQKKFEDQQQSKLTHITDEFHLVNDLQINVLIEMNIMSSKECILNFKIKNMIFFACENIAIFIFIVRTKQFVNRSVLAAEKIVISFHFNMIVFIKIRRKSLSNRDYIFNSKKEILLNSEKRFFNHVLFNSFVKILVRNTST